MKSEITKRFIYILISFVICLNAASTAIAAGDSGLSTLRETSEAFSSVAAYSPAYMKGIEPGAVILSVNKKAVGSVLEFNKALKEADKEKRVLLLLEQDSYTRFVVLS